MIYKREEDCYAKTENNDLTTPKQLNIDTRVQYNTTKAQKGRQ